MSHKLEDFKNDYFEIPHWSEEDAPDSPQKDLDSVFEGVNLDDTLEDEYT